MVGACPSTIKGFTMSLATRLSNIELEDSDGKAQKLSAYWRQQPIVLVFIRHFG
jgi:hypothetical protein